MMYVYDDSGFFYTSFHCCEMELWTANLLSSMGMLGRNAQELVQA